MNEALQESLSFTPLHGFNVMELWVWACRAKSNEPKERIAYDLRCEACLLVALAHLAQGHNPAIDAIEDQGVGRFPMTLSRGVRRSIRKYGWDEEETDGSE